MIRLARPSISENAINKVSDVLRSGNLVQGEFVKEFELKLQKYLGVENAIAVSSGTAALHLSLLSLEIGAGDEVIVPNFTFPATANVVELVGAKPVFVDITLEDYCIDITKIEKVITSNTKAIIPVHEFGLSADMDPILKLAKKYNLEVVEDSACALGAEYNGNKTGTMGTIGCFSLHPRKAITTGEGGIVVTNNNTLAEKIRALRNHGISIFNSQIDFLYAGLNYRMTDFQAVIGIDQLKIINNLIENNLKIAELYDEELKNLDWLKTPKFKNIKKPVYQTYFVLLEENISQKKVISKLKDNNIESNIGAYALNLLSFYRKKYDFPQNRFPNSERAFKTGIAIPMGQHLKSENILYISKTLGEII